MSKFDSGRFDVTGGSGGGSGGGDDGGGGGGGNALPSNESQLAHMFSDRPGHLPNTEESREAVVKLVNDYNNFVDVDSRGLQWYSQITPEGTQLWASVYNGVVQNCGENETPHTWDPRTGFSYNPFKGRN